MTPDSERAQARRLLAVVGLVFVFALGPWALGVRTPVLRDALGTHRPLKAFGAAELAEGRIPAFRSDWALGQPFRGNPNGAPFYPGNIAYFVLPFDAAFGLHYAVHALIGLVGAAVAGRRLGLGPLGAAVAATTYAGSGFALSALSFYNLVVVAAWFPWAVAGLADERPRGLALAGLCGGLAILGGEPVSFALSTILLLAVAVQRHGVARGGGRFLLAMAIAGAVGAVQIAATSQVMPFSYRVAHGLEARETIFYRFDWRRLLELVLPLPWGSPGSYRAGRYFTSDVMSGAPYFWTAYLGVLPLALLPGSFRGNRALVAVASGSLAAAVLASLSGARLAELSGGIFRYPEKLLVPFSLAAALVVGVEIERRAANRSLASALIVAAAALGLVGASLYLGRARVAEWLRGDLGATLGAESATTVVVSWAAAALLGAALLGAAAIATRKGSLVTVAWIQAASLLQLAPLVVSDRTAAYDAESELERNLNAKATMVVVPAQTAQWEPFATGGSDLATPRDLARLARFELQPAFGIERGYSYPTAPDLEGMTSVLSVFVERNLPRVPWPGRVRWLRRLGVEWVVRHDPSPTDIDDLEPVGSWSVFGITVALTRVSGARTFPYWPRDVQVAANPRDAFVEIARGEIEDATVVASRPVRHVPGADLGLLRERGDEIRFEVSGGGGIAVLERAYWPNYSARLEDGTELAIQPVDVCLLGVEVPPGRHEVVVDVPDRSVVAGGVVTVLALLGCLVILGRRAR